MNSKYKLTLFLGEMFTFCCDSWDLHYAELSQRWWQCIHTEFEPQLTEFLLYLITSHFLVAVVA